MATKQLRRVHRSLISVVCLSVIAAALVLSTSSDAEPPGPSVTVVNTPLPVSVQGTVPTQNVGGGAATHVGQVASKIVNLLCISITNQPCTTVSGPFTVPSGQAFILTDIQWQILNSPAGQGNYDSVGIDSGGNGLASFSAPVDAKTNCFGQAHLTTGVVVPPGEQIQVSVRSGLPEIVGASIQGYLVPNQ